MRSADQQRMGAVLKAAILTDEAMGFLPVDQAEWLSMAAQEYMDGCWPAGYTLEDAAQVIVGRASECMIGQAPSSSTLLRHLPPHPTRPEGWAGAFLARLSDITGMPLSQTQKAPADWEQALKSALQAILGETYGPS